MMKILLAVIAVATIAQLTTATNYTVGAPSGSWDLNTNLTQWVDSSTFTIGDFVIFSYNPSAHNVLEVTQTDYNSCTTSSPISTYTSGNTVMSIAILGDTNGIRIAPRYFICGIPGHCLGGMKVSMSFIYMSTTASGTPTTPSESGTSSTVTGSGLGLGLAALLVLLSI